MGDDILPILRVKFLVDKSPKELKKTLGEKIILCVKMRRLNVWRY